MHFSPYDNFPKPISSAAILKDLKPGTAKAMPFKLLEVCKILSAFLVCLMVGMLLYWPIARALAWGVLFLAKLVGTNTAELPPYTPYPAEL